MAVHVDGMHEFTKDNVSFIVGPKHVQAFEGIKQEITSAPILKYYDTCKPLSLQNNANLKGIKVGLLQEGHPIYLLASDSNHIKRPMLWLN